MPKIEPLSAAATVDAPTRVCVIAEMGVNHDGDRDLARRLVDDAAAAGADAIKVQLFHPDRLLSNQARLAGYQVGSARDLHSLLASLAMGVEELGPIGDHARAAGLRFIVTPFSVADVDDLRALGVDAVKIASPDAVNLPLLSAAMALELPMFVSTGTAALDELMPAMRLLRGHGAGAVMLQCVSCYPTPRAQAALGGMVALRGALMRLEGETLSPGTPEEISGDHGHRPRDLPVSIELRGEKLPGEGTVGVGLRGAKLPGEGTVDAGGRGAQLPGGVGYSDHTGALDVGAMAVMAGAVVLEKHLTHDRSAPGPDHAASLTGEQFGEYVRRVREAALMLGPVVKRPLEIEGDVRAVSRQSVCVVRDLRAGHVLGAADLTVKRPGTGIPAAELGGVIGRVLGVDVRANDLLEPGQLADNPAVKTDCFSAA